jgi:hypothetical protein
MRLRRSVLRLSKNDLSHFARFRRGQWGTNTSRDQAPATAGGHVTCWSAQDMVLHNMCALNEHTHGSCSASMHDSMHQLLQFHAVVCHTLHVRGGVLDFTCRCKGARTVYCNVQYTVCAHVRGGVLRLYMYM